MPFDQQKHDLLFGIAEDRKKAGGSNAGKYKKGPYCGPSGGAPKGTYPVDTEKRAKAALAYANNAPNPAGIKKCVYKNWPSLNKEGKQADLDVAGFSEQKDFTIDAFDGYISFKEVKAEEGKPTKAVASMYAYSGAPVEGYFGPIVVDLKGIKKAQDVLPVLEDHYTEKKIGFSDDIDIGDDGISFNDIQLLETTFAEEFYKNAKAGFPYQASIGFRHKQVQVLQEKETTEVNGFTIEGPAFIVRESVLKEASVCVFGRDSNTDTVAYIEGGADIESSILEGKDQQEEMKMAFDPNQFKDDEAFQKFVAGFKEQEVKLSERVEALQKDLSKTSTEKGEFADRIAKLEALAEKEATLRKEMAIKAQAEAILEKKFSEGSVVDRFRDKIRKMVSYHGFVSGDVLDVEKFSAAVDAEIKDFAAFGTQSEAPIQGKGSASGVAPGQGDTSSEFSEEKLRSYGDSLAEMIGLAPVKQ